MVVTREYITVLPFTCEEYQVAQRWFEFHKNDGKLLDIQKSCVLPTTGESGLYTRRLCADDNRTPRFIRSIAPAGSLDMYQEMWSCSSHQKCVLTNGYLKDKFSIKVTTKWLPDTGNSENVHGLPEKKLKNVERVVIDIASEADQGSGDRSDDITPANFVSVKTGRGKLGRHWVNDALAANGDKRIDGTVHGTTPLMCCYVLAEVEVKIFGLQSKLEKSIQAQTKTLLLENYRKMLYSIDSWHGLNVIDIGSDVTTENDDEGENVASKETKAAICS